MRKAVLLALAGAVLAVIAGALALPVDGVVASSGACPTRAQLARMVGRGRREPGLAAIR